MSAEFQFAPLRSTEDFILSKARFQKPKCSQRILSNLLYYQTNYLLIAALVFIISGVVAPLKMLWAVVVIAIASLAILFASRRLSDASKGRPTSESPNRTYLLLAVIAITAYLLLYNLHSIAILLSPIVITLVIVLLHSSMRTRNLKNKITNTMDKVNIFNPKKTPMGIILDFFNVSADDFLK